MTQESFKCYCKYNSGGARWNQIMCGFRVEKDGTITDDFQPTAFCEYDEWCTGASNANESVQGEWFGRDALCIKGILRKSIS